MLIISVKDNKNSRWKRDAKAKFKKQKKRTRGTEAIVRGWEINDFVEHLSWVFFN